MFTGTFSFGCRTTNYFEGVQVRRRGSLSEAAPLGCGGRRGGGLAHPGGEGGGPTDPRRRGPRRSQRGDGLVLDIATGLDTAFHDRGR